MRALFIITLLLAAATSVARAQPAAAGDEAEAREHFNAGQELVAARRFAEAYAEFERGYTLSQKPLFLFNMGECARAMNDATRARRAYERYLQADPNGSRAAVARTRLAALPAAKAPLPEPADNPGAKPAKATAGTPKSLEPRLQLESHESASAPAPVAVTPIDTRASRSVWRRWETWTIGAVGTALVLGSVAVYAASRSDEPTCGAGCVDLR